MAAHGHAMATSAVKNTVAARHGAGRPVCLDRLCDDQRRTTLGDQGGSEIPSISSTVETGSFTRKNPAPVPFQTGEENREGPLTHSAGKVWDG